MDNLEAVIFNLIESKHFAIKIQNWNLGNFEKTV